MIRDRKTAIWLGLRRRLLLDATTLIFSAFKSVSNVLSLDASTAEGSGTATFARSSTAYVQNHLGVYHQVSSGVERWVGARYSGDTAYDTDASGNPLRPTNQPDDGSSDTRYAVYSQWQASTAYSVGDRIIPTDVSEFFCRGLSDVYLECTTAGTSAGSEPTWDRTLTNTTADNTAVWTCKGYYTLKGVLIEGAETNEALWARDFTNAVWTATNVTTAKDATGADGVANAASTLTASAGNGTVFQTITLGSAAYTTSFLVKRKTGTGTIEITDDGGATYTDITALINTSNYEQVSVTQTQANPSIGFRIVTSADAIEVDMAQCESSSVASSPIPTTTGTVTRAAETLNYPNASNIDGAIGSILLDFAFPERQIMWLCDFSTASTKIIYHDTTTSIRTHDGTNNLAKGGLNAADENTRIGVRWENATLKKQHTVGGSASAEGAFVGDWSPTAIYLGYDASDGADQGIKLLLNARIYSDDKGQAWLEGETAND